MPHFLRASSTTKKIVFPLAFGAFALVAVHAGAQQASPPPGPTPSASDPARPGGAPDGARPDDGRNRPDRPRFSEEDRTAFFNARLASIRAGLMLTPDQDKMWPPVEAAVRDLIKLRGEQRAQFQAQRQALSQSSGQSQGQPQDPAQAQQSNPLERLRLRGEAQMKHGEAVKKFAEAALPLYSSLNDDQKRRLRFLGRGLGQGMMGQQGMQQNDRRGPNDRGYDGRGDRRWRDMDQRRGGYRGRDDNDRDDRRGYGDRGGYGDRRGSNDYQGYRPRSRQDAQDSSDGFDRGNGIEDWRDRF